MSRAGGNGHMARALEANMRFRDSDKPDDVEFREDGSGWWKVGRNSTHYFYLGFLPDGTPGHAAEGYGDPWQQWALDDGGGTGYMGHQ